MEPRDTVQEHEVNMRGAQLVVRGHRIDVRAVLAAAIAPLEGEAKDREVKLELLFAANVPQEAVVDRGKLVWGITMLAGNALRYVSRGARVRPQGSVAIAVGWDGTANELVFEIVDDGPGMPPRVAEVLTHDEDASEVAPALQVLRDVMVAIGGRVEISTARDDEARGTRLRFRVPAKAKI